MSSPLPFPDNLVSPWPGSWKFRFDLANLANKARSLVAAAIYLRAESPVLTTTGWAGPRLELSIVELNTRDKDTSSYTLSQPQQHIEYDSVLVGIIVAHRRNV